MRGRAIAMECDVNNVRRTAYGLPPPQTAKVAFLMEDLSPGSCPTPREIFGQIGRVIAVCLGLGVLAHALVALVGG